MRYTREDLLRAKAGLMDMVGELVNLREMEQNPPKDVTSLEGRIECSTKIGADVLSVIACYKQVEQNAKVSLHFFLNQKELPFSHPSICDPIMWAYIEWEKAHST